LWKRGWQIFLRIFAFTRQTLDRRYENDLESGRVKPIPGEEVFARLPGQEARPAAREASMRGYELIGGLSSAVALSLLRVSSKRVLFGDTGYLGRLAFFAVGSR